MGAAEDDDAGLGNFEMFGEYLNEDSVRLAVVRLSAEIDGELDGVDAIGGVGAVGRVSAIGGSSHDDFFLATARFDCD